MVPPPTAEALLSHTGFVRHLALRLLRDAHEAEDVVQQVFLAALRRPPEPSRPLRPWLTRVAHNLAIDMHRARGRRDQSERAAAHDDIQPSTGHIVALDSAQQGLVASVVDLPEPYRTTIFLHFYEELPPRTIAKRQNVPVETVRTRIKRGVAMLRGRLNGKDDERKEYWAVALVQLSQTPTASKPSAWERLLPITAAASIGALCAWLWTADPILGAGDSAPVAQVVAPAPAPTTSETTPTVPPPERVDHAVLPPPEEARLHRLRIITDEGEFVVPDARVDIFSGGTKVAEVRTDENGEIELPNGHGADFEIRVGMTRVSLAYSTELDLGKSVTADEPTLVRVPAASTVSGRVLDEQGFVVPFARVVAWSGFTTDDEQWRYRSPGHRVIANRNGEFTMLGLRHHFRLEAFWNHLVAKETFVVNLDRAQHIDDVELRVCEPRLVRGSVVDEFGIAVHDASVRTVANAGDRPGRDSGTIYVPRDDDRARTEPDGTFVISGITSVGPTIVVEHPDHAPHVLPPPDPNDVNPQETVDIALETGSTLNLWVSDTAGKGIPGASAQFYDLVGTVRRVVSNDLGYVRFDHMPSTSAGFLRVDAAGYAPDIREVKKIGKKKVSTVDIDLPPPRVVRGRVLGVGRIPIRGAIVRARLTDPDNGPTDPVWRATRDRAALLGHYLTPADGKFKFPWTPWRSFVLDVTTPQGHHRMFEVDYNQVVIECTFEEDGPATPPQPKK
ncbi:MAG: sigma-70 family RNA polymerase sigma factor [Planctomycetota bacterium]